MNSRAFHYSEGTSHKFWSITVEGSALTVRFGRIGGAGQSQTKRFPTNGEAEQSARKLISAKLRKGYIEGAPEAAPGVAAKKRAPEQAPPQLLLPF